MYTSVHDDYVSFRLPAWFNGPGELVRILESLWTHTPDYLGDLSPDERRRVVREGYARIADALLGAGDAVGYHRCVYFGWALAIECATTILFFDKDSDVPGTVLGAGPIWLDDKLSIVEQDYDWAAFFETLFPSRRDEAYDAAILTLQDFTRLLTHPEAAHEIICEMIEYCTDWFALAPGAWSFETIWRWVLVEVIPAAWSLRLPERQLPRDPRVRQPGGAATPWI